MIRISKKSVQRLESVVRSYRDHGLVRKFCEGAGIKRLVLTSRQRRILRERGWKAVAYEPFQPK